MNIRSTFGEKECENPITITKKPTYSYVLKVNTISSLTKNIQLGPISLSLTVDFVMSQDILGIPSFMLKLPSIPSIDLHLPSLPTIDISATIPVVLPAIDTIALPEPPTIEMVLPSRPTISTYPTEINVSI